jgi:CBS-domain-containing membrane protein
MLLLLSSSFLFFQRPFGAFVTLLYGLTAAPASQPWNALLGQTLSISIALVISYADSVEIWIRQSLATAIAVASMVGLGITHPPAGAAALIFSSGSLGWGNVAFTLVGNAIAIGMATFLNNVSSKRQYPTFWGLQYRVVLEKGCVVSQFSLNATKPFLSYYGRTTRTAV